MVYKIIILLVIGLILSLSSRTAHGYIDPGTTSSIFAILAPLFSMIILFLGFLFRPIKRFFILLINTFRRVLKI
ncbi:MAG: hypothetical protein HY999_04555 [Nitrospinae bacterium]|nr:hypothetical protein [Nitrospinota bacterium]